MRKESDMGTQESYESRKYGAPSKALGRSNGPLTPAPDSLSARKQAGQHKADYETQIPHPRGCSCYRKAEKMSY